MRDGVVAGTATPKILNNIEKLKVSLLRLYEKESVLREVHEILNKLWVLDKKILFVCNKIDLIKNIKTKTFLKKYKKFCPSMISAINKIWIKELKIKIENCIIQ